MNTFTNSCILTGIISLFFGLFVAAKNRKSGLNLLWCMISTSVAFWSIGLGLMVSAPNYSTAVLWLRLHYVGAILIPLFFLHFAIRFVNRKRSPPLLGAAYGLATLFIVLSFAGRLVDAVPKDPFNFYTKPLGFYPLYVAFFLWAILYSHYLLVLEYMRASYKRKTQVKYLFLGTGLGFLGGSTAFFPVFDWPVFPYGVYLVAVYMVMVGYSIARHRLMDISVVFNRGLAYVFLIVLTILPLLLSVALSPHASIYSIPPLLAGALIFSCGLWIALKNPRSAMNITFSLVCVGVCIWLFSVFMMYSTADAHEALFWGKLIFVGVAFIPAFFYHFCVSLLRRKEDKKILLANYIVSAFFLAFLPTDYFISGLYSYFWGHYPKAGVLHPFFLAYFFFVSGLSLQRLYRGYKAKEEILPREAIRIKYVFWAFVIGYTASIDYIQFYGFEVYPTGYIFVTLWTLIVSYAIAKYQVMNISLIITRAKLIPYLQVLALIPLYGLILFIGYFIDGSVHYVSSGVALAVFILTAGLVQNAKEQAEQMVQRMLFKKSYETYQVLQKLNKAMVTILDPKELTCKIVETLSSATGVLHATLFLQDDKGDYRLAASASNGLGEGTATRRPNKKEIVQAETDRVFFSWLEQQEKVIELEEMEHEGREKEILPMARKYFSEVGAKLCLPLVHQRKLIGMINLGEKARGDPYTHSDIDLLSSLRAQASIALSNALVYHGVRQISQGLEHEVAQRTHELAESKREVEAAYQKLQELDQFKSQFFANISHEVRTPLTLILAPLQSLLTQPALPEEAQRQMNIMYQNGLRLLRLINNLLDFAKIDAGKMGLTYGRVDFIPFVKGIVVSAFPLAEKKQIHLHFSGAQDTMIFYFDQDKIEKVLLNLIFNALKFTPSGGQVAVSCQREGQTVKVAVADSGIGIAKEDLPRLFSRFSQVDASASRRFEGTGLGLALAKDFVELHEGKIWAESEPGRGTVMIFTLPFMTQVGEGTADGLENRAATRSLENGAATRGLKNEAAARVKEVGIEAEGDWTQSLRRAAEYSMRGIINEAFPGPHPNGDNPVTGQTILLVEDNPDMLQFLASHLQDHYRILTAANGAQGLERARTQRPALILSDVMMPVMDGYQLCRELKSDPGTMHIPVILLTAKADLSMKIEGLECGADEYLTKPFSSEELRARIKSLLSLRELEAGLIQSEKMAALGLLVAGVTHEINNPLHFSRINLSNLRRAIERLNEKLNAMAINEADLRPLLEEIPDDVRIVNTGLERIERVVHDLKAFIRKDTEQFVPTDLHEGIESTLALLKGGLGGKIEVVKEYGEIAPVNAIPGQINQVFLNLIQNAVHAIPKERKGRIAIRTWREGEVVKVAIGDNGEGIRPENLRRIFDPFFTTKEVGKGTGLGLWVCNRIMVKHGGSIEVNSEPGAGTQMCLTFPLRKP